MRHTGLARLGDNVEISVGDSAHLRLVVVAEWDRESTHVEHQKARLGRDAKLDHIAVTLGGDLVRQYLSVDYAGRGGSVDAFGLYFADAGQHLEQRQLVDHSVPDCRSNVNYRGALQGQDAHTVWIGDVLIQDAATGTDTYEINRNLVLSDGARADSVPNLEIETGEIVGRRPRLDHRPLRRGAPVLPPVPRHPRAGGPPPGRQGLLQRDRPEDPRRGTARGAHRTGRRPARRRTLHRPRRGRGGCVDDRQRFPARLRARGTAGVRAHRGRHPRHLDRARAQRRGGVRPLRRVLPRRRGALRRATSRTARSNAGSTGRASTCAPANRPDRPPPWRSRPIRSRSATATSTSA